MFTSVAFLLIILLPPVQNVTLVIREIELHKRNLNVVPVVIGTMLTLLAALIFLLDFSPDNMVPVSKKVIEFYKTFNYM